MHEIGYNEKILNELFGVFIRHKLNWKEIFVWGQAISHLMFQKQIKNYEIDHTKDLGIIKVLGDKYEQESLLYTALIDCMEGKTKESG